MENTNGMVSGSDQPGSIIYTGPTDPNKLGGDPVGQPENGSQVDYKELYEEIQRKLGEQGRELGEYRNFFDGVSPILDRLDKNPELVQAIVEGTIDDKLLESVLSGNVSVGEAKIITQAHTEVKKDMGNTEYEKTPVNELDKLVEQRISQIKEELESKIQGNEDARVFEQKVNDFISRTPDFVNYAEVIEKWLEQHEDVTDIEVAYYAVKGKMAESDAAKKAELEKAEYEKGLAQGGGIGSNGSTVFPEGVNPADVLISGRSNPNIF